VNPSTPGSQHRGTDLRAEMEERIQRQRQRPVPPWLASRGRRRGLALVPAATFLLGGLAAPFGASAPGFLLMILASLCGAAGTLLLRRATQMLDAAPLGLLDEREIVQRNQAYRRGHWLTLALVGVMWLMAVIDGFVMNSDAPVLSCVGWVFLTLAALLAISMLPAAALAWVWETPPDTGEDDG
jgi:hypothetical protein